MSQWPSSKARIVFAALLSIGWHIKRDTAGSHRVLSRTGFPDYTCALTIDEVKNMRVFILGTGASLEDMKTSRARKKLLPDLFSQMAGSWRGQALIS